MTNGEPSGTNGAELKAFWLSILIATVAACTLNTFNVFTALQDDPGSSVSGLIVTEGSSAISGLLWVAIPLWLVKRRPLDRPPLWKTLVIHAAGLLTFSVLHVAGMVLLRQLAWPVVMGTAYDFGNLPERFPYELRKDAVSYTSMTVGFWMVRELLVTRAAKSPEPEIAMLDIRDGPKMVRTPVGEILAVSSAGNYVEFHLSDGRRPLMRSSLSNIQTRLAPHGFVRTHRSWLVNAARVTAIAPEGSGDYAVTLGRVVAPVSRRYREGLAKLRGG